jgi:TRAP transporter TAXI family solute receptor
MIRTGNLTKLKPEKIGILVLVLITAVLAAIGGSALLDAMSTKQVVIAAGPARAESYVLLSALKAVVERHYPRVRILIHETSDTNENLRRLERGDAQFAASQADANAGPSARVVAVLFEDTFQVLVHADSGIKQFTDLKGKRIALATRGAQYQTFLFLAGHFGLKESDFSFLGQDDETADVSFARKDADAIFRVRALNNASVERTAHTAGVSFIPIEDAQAMHIQMPAYIPTTIPKGTYLGNPPVPATDIQTVASEHTLLVRQDVDDDIVAAITQVLMERRPELGAVIARTDPSVLPLLAQLKQPVMGMGLGLGIHPGAMQQYQHGKPPFVQTHADLVALLLVLFVLVGLWMWALKVAILRRQKARVDGYIHRTAEMMAEIEATNHDRSLAPVRRELMLILTQAIMDLQQDEMDQGSFQAVHLVWQIAYDSLRERRAAIRNRQVPAQAPAPVPVAHPAPAPAEKPGWSFARFLQTKSD